MLNWRKETSRLFKRRDVLLFNVLLCDVPIMRCLTYEVTTACVTIAPRAESASLLLKLPVKSSQIPIQLNKVKKFNDFHDKLIEVELGFFYSF